MSIGIPDHKARGVKSYECESWEEAALTAVEKVFGRESKELAEFIKIFVEMRENPYFANDGNQRGYVAQYLYYFRRMVKQINKLSLLQNENDNSGENTLNNYVTINLGDGATFTGPLSVGENIRVSYEAVSGIKESSIRELLEETVKQVSALIEDTTSEDRKNEISTQLKAFVTEAKSDKPSKWMLDVSSKGLIEAAQTVAALATPVTSAVQAVLRLITNGS